MCYISLAIHTGVGKGLMLILHDVGSVVVHTLYRVSLCTVLLPVLGMLILCVLLSHKIVGKVCICYLSLCSIFLLHNILFVTLGVVLPLFDF
jgi:hypothetical protein